MNRHARSTVTCAVAVSLALLASVAHAQSTWNTTSGSFGTAGNWLGGVPSGVGAIADFSKVNLTTTATVAMSSSARTLGTMLVGDTDGSNPYNFAADSTGANGGAITWDVSSGAALLHLTGGATFRSATWTLNDNLNIQQDGSGAVQSFAAINTGVNARIMTLTGTGSGPFAFTGATSNIQGALKIVVDNPNGLFGIGASTGASNITAGYTGGTEVKKGTFAYRSGSSNFTAAGGVTLGETSGTSNATFRIVSNNDRSVNKAFTLAANSSGTLKIAADGESTGTRTYTFSGGVSGNYGLTLENAGGDENLTFTTTALDFTGALTHTGTGTGLLTISSTIGTNVTGVTQNSTTSRMILNAANTYTGPTTITSGTLSLGASASLASGTMSVASGAVFDVASVTGGYTLGSGQTLGGLGTIVGSGSFAAGSFLTLTRDCLTGKPCRGRPAGSRAMRPGSTR